MTLLFSNTVTVKALGLAAALSIAACGTQEQNEAGGSESIVQALKLDSDFINPNDPSDDAEPASDYTLFEADPVRPIAVLEKSGLVAVTNTFDDYLELLKSNDRGVERCGAVKVGMRPVAVAVVAEGRTRAEVWVVNHLSDSVSIVQVRTDSCEGEVVRTLHVGDEPRDIVVAPTTSGERRVFVATAHRGQRHPLETARLATDLVTPAGAKEQPGLADVLVFEAEHPSRPPSVVNLFTDTPRALAVGDGVVYAAGFHTGNRTTVVPAEIVAARGVESLGSLLAQDGAGNFVEADGELVLDDGAQGQTRIEGGQPAVVGVGRCMPDPRPDRADRFLQQVCVETDGDNRVQRVLIQQQGQVSASCQCTSGDGTLQPTTGVIAKFFDSAGDCGSAFTTFPDGNQGCWLDAAPEGAPTPAAQSARQAPAMSWNDQVKFSLPDQDVFAIDVDSLELEQSFPGVGAILFSLAVQPGTGKLFVANTEAANLTRFEGRGESSSTTVRGHLHESRVTIIDPDQSTIVPVHLNTHIDYEHCCDRNAAENEKSFAFPTAGVFSADGKDFYFTALGSDKVGLVRSRALSRRFDNERARQRGQLRDVSIGDDAFTAPAGPVGLALDDRRQRLYVTTQFTNELVVVDPERARVIDRVALPSPEPESITRGRHVLYNARLTSAHGDSACASCHVFGNFDSLSWDLGDSDGATVKNPGPFAVPTEFVELAGIARDPFGEDPANRPPTPDFRSNKGPMSTQTLRGLANHGAQHWRGDRTRRFQDATGQQPNFGSLNEDNSFSEFDVAIVGLNGNDEPLDARVFQDFTNFSLQLTLPPNPIRALDNSLSTEQAAARALYFGCASMSDEEFMSRECVGPDGSVVDLELETEQCGCANNPLLALLRNNPQIQGVASLLQLLLSNPALRGAVEALAADTTGLPSEAEPVVGASAVRLVEGIDQLLTVDSLLDERGLFTQGAAEGLAQLSGGLLGVVGISSAYGTPTGQGLLGLLASSIPPGALPPESPLYTTTGLQATFESAFGLANLNLRTIADEAARGTGDFHNLLLGCSVTEVASCRLRVTDSFQTCHGCHTLDPHGNAEFGAFRPGFFGTSGEYSFENESQVFKIPHLRNAYQKVGMFGMTQVPFFLPEAVLGPNSGGLFAPANRFMGEQVRGSGFLHDGSTDTVHRFVGATVFVNRPRGQLGAGDPGNARALDAVFPRASDRASCVQSFRQAPLAALGAFPSELTQALGFCLATSPLPDVCFLDAADPACVEVLDGVAQGLGDETFPDTFQGQILPLCFQFGSTLEGGSEAGACFPNGLRERAQLESFILAFDSNLKPMVGQQLTLSNAEYDEASLGQMLGSAEQRHCDIAVHQKGRGWVIADPDAATPGRSALLDSRGRASQFADLVLRTGPITLTCYPPQAGQAEARRAAFARSRSSW